PIGSGGGTPLGDAVAFAQSYLATNAVYPQQKFLVFSDGASNCGASTVAPAITTPAVTPPAPAMAEPATDPEPAEPSISWWSYRLEITQRPFRPVVDVVQIHYEEATGDRPWSAYTQTRYPVSSASSGGRVLWSIGWASPEDLGSTRAEGTDVAALRSRADALRNSAVERSGLSQAVTAAFGDGAQALAP
ncbi:MAG: hypothetical protein HN768_08085, partial [Rhodospirillaceae bacterium]|nr:hypothetical protein [Rhodospirillaceae bacterium]